MHKKKGRSIYSSVPPPGKVEICMYLKGKEGLQQKVSDIRQTTH